MNKMQSITSAEEFITVIREPQRTVMLFSADWCPDCRYFDRFMDEVVAAQKDVFVFYKVDRDRLPELCDMYDILGIPSFLVFHDGQIVGRFVSKLRKTRAEVEDFLAQVVAQEVVQE